MILGSSAYSITGDRSRVNAAVNLGPQIVAHAGGATELAGELLRPRQHEYRDLRENYVKNPDELLTPAKKDQAPPDFKYSNKAAKWSRASGALPPRSRRGPTDGASAL